MTLPTASSAQTIGPAQVWTRLAADLRQRTICFMAQLAYNFVAAQPEWSAKEAQLCSPVSPPLKSGPNISTGKP